MNLALASGTMSRMELFASKRSAATLPQDVLGKGETKTRFGYLA